MGDRVTFLDANAALRSSISAALAKPRTPTEMRVAAVVWQLTAGWSQLEDRVSVGQIAALAGMDGAEDGQRNRVRSALRRLAEDAVIVYRPGSVGRSRTTIIGIPPAGNGVSGDPITHSNNGVSTDPTGWRNGVSTDPQMGSVRVGNGVSADPHPRFSKNSKTAPFKAAAPLDDAKTSDAMLGDTEYTGPTEGGRQAIARLRQSWAGPMVPSAEDS